MHITVFPFLDEILMRFEIELLRMFKDQVCSRMKNITGEHLVRNCRQILKSIWGIGKDNIEFLMTYLEKFKNIVTDDCQILHAELSSL